MRVLVIGVGYVSDVMSLDDLLKSVFFRGCLRPNQFVLIFHRKKENRIIISTDLDFKTFMYEYGVKEK